MNFLMIPLSAGSDVYGIFHGSDGLIGSGSSGACHRLLKLLGGSLRSEAMLQPTNTDTSEGLTKEDLVEMFEQWLSMIQLG